MEVLGDGPAAAIVRASAAISSPVLAAARIVPRKALKVFRGGVYSLWQGSSFDPEMPMRHRWLIALFTAALLGACAKPEGGDAAKMEMRVYAVPAEQTQALATAIGNVLGTAYDKTSFGKVSSPSPGQLVVLAPASLQGSIESTLRDLTKADPLEAKPSANDESPLRLSFWSVDAVPGNGTDDPALKALMLALDEMRKQMGAVHFVLHDQMSGISNLDNTVNRTWFSKNVEDVNQPVRLEYVLRQTGGRLSLGMDLYDQVPVTMHYNNVAKTQYQSITTKSTATITPGQTLILTQTPLPGDAEDKAPTTRLYVVRIDPVKAG